MLRISKNFVLAGWIGHFGEGQWREAPSFDPCYFLRPVSCHPRPSTPTPCLFSPTNNRSSWMGGRRGGNFFYDFFAIFSPPSLFGFQTHSFLPHPLESGGHHLYRCLGIKALWSLLLNGGLGQPWLGQRARSWGGYPLFQPAEWASVPTDRDFGGLSTRQRWGNVYKVPHAC